ncbi:hypothetical protein [Desulfosoma caldarium]|uniref:Chordopoxvirus fusion protein n=1 Tax=Desulfosoma caldarium TaxID=610254 RepID=A0A3N1UR50_9BACT|nr:hypothetical protein [Desulfosoma caldarium]ROQ93564.1 hypothetical protein EDC27_1592 [Desulfosoma caldarium]
MAITASLIRKLDQFPEDLREVLLAIIEELETYRRTVVTKADFADLKAVVADLAGSVRDLSEAQKRTEEKVFQLAEAQKRTEERLNELAEAQKRTEERLNELAEAQKRTEERLNELAEAQKRTEERLNELAEAQKRTEYEVGTLAKAIKGTRDQVGGLSRSMAYALENEAYRKLPTYLHKVHHIQVTESFIRTEVAQEEVNFWAKALKEGKEVRLVGESVLRLDDASKLKALLRKLQKIGRVVVADLVPILVTHYATPKLLQQATEKGILVVHSYQWDQDF